MTESQIPKQRWNKGERCMYIFCGKCHHKTWNLGQRQTLEKAKIRPLERALAVTEQEMAGTR